MQTDKEQEQLVSFWDGVEVHEEDTAMTDPLDEEEEVIDDDLETEDDEESILDELDLGDDENEDNDGVDDEEVPLVDTIKDSLGFDFGDRVFEDTEEGIQLLVEEASKLLADDQLDSIFSQYPDVKELYEFRSLGGDPQKYLETKFPTVDYTKVEFNEDDSQQHESIVRKELSIRGYSSEEIEHEVEDIKNGGILESKAKRALGTLKAKQQEEQESLLESQRISNEQQKKQITEYWESVENVIETSTSFKNFKVPATDKKDFFEYISKPVEGGKSKRDLDVEKADLETRLAIDFLLYKGLDISGIVSRRAKDMNAKSLRKRMKQRKLDSEKQRRSVASDPNEPLGTI